MPCPIKKIKVCSVNPKWFSSELAEEIYHRDHLYMVTKASRDIARGLKKKTY